MNGGPAMVRGDHRDNLRDFAYPGQSIALLEVAHQFIYPLAAWGNMPSYRDIVFWSKTKRPRLHPKAMIAIVYP
jgi:hypothetical protein